MMESPPSTFEPLIMSEKNLPVVEHLIPDVDCHGSQSSNKETDRVDDFLMQEKQQSALDGPSPPGLEDVSSTANISTSNNAPMEKSNSETAAIVVREIVDEAFENIFKINNSNDCLQEKSYNLNENDKFSETEDIKNDLKSLIQVKLSSPDLKCSETDSFDSSSDKISFQDNNSFMESQEIINNGSQMHVIKSSLTMARDFIIINTKNDHNENGSDRIQKNELMVFNEFSTFDGRCEGFKKLDFSILTDILSGRDNFPLYLPSKISFKNTFFAACGTGLTNFQPASDTALICSFKMQKTAERNNTGCLITIEQSENLLNQETNRVSIAKESNRDFHSEVSHLIPKKTKKENNYNGDFVHYVNDELDRAIEDSIEKYENFTVDASVLATPSTAEKACQTDVEEPQTLQRCKRCIEFHDEPNESIKKRKMEHEAVFKFPEIFTRSSDEVEEIDDEDEGSLFDVDENYDELNWSKNVSESDQEVPVNPLAVQRPLPSSSYVTPKKPVLRVGLSRSARFKPLHPRM